LGIGCWLLVISNILPAAFFNSWQQSLARQLSEMNPAQSKFSHISSFSSAHKASQHRARRKFRFFVWSCYCRLLSHVSNL